MSHAHRIINLSASDATADGSANSEERKVSKFMVISTGDSLVFLYGSIEEFPYHAQLIKRYCDWYGVPSGWVKKPDLYQIYDNTYQLRGGGWFEEKSGEKLLRFYGFSTAYGPFEPQDILYLFEQAEPFAGFKVDIPD